MKSPNSPSLWLRLVLAACCVGVLRGAAVPEAGDPVRDHPDMTWFSDARLGIFIHWGVYSEGKGSESWAFHEGEMPHDEYFAQAATFTAAKYDPAKWAELFKRPGPGTPCSPPNTTTVSPSGTPGRAS